MRGKRTEREAVRDFLKIPVSFRHVPKVWKGETLTPYHLGFGWNGARITTV